MKKISVLGLIGSIVGLVTSIVFTVLLANEKWVIVQNHFVFVTLIVIIINIISLVVFGVKRNTKLSVVIPNTLSIVLSLYVTVMLLIRMVLVDNPLVGGGAFIVVEVILVIANSLSLASLLEK